MKQRIIDILSVFFRAIDTLLCRCRIVRPKVVVFQDGGVCSQMLTYLYGQCYAEAGFDVLYDDFWYKTNGKEEGAMSRTFELTEMWPNLAYKRPTWLQRKWYLLFFKAERINADWLPKPTSVRHSIYLYGYWDIPADVHSRFFGKCYKIQEAAVPAIGVNKVFDGTVGVHVRRGDLAKGDNPYYGGVTDGYFLRAIEFCNREFRPKRYVFFSDEPDWVKTHICSQMKHPYEIVRGNKAWEDLWLLAQCPIIIASQGSFGKVAAHLNPEADRKSVV